MPFPSSDTAANPRYWRENIPYLYGIDLYHEGFLWESHEAWEHLWKLAPPAGTLAGFLQALILNSAAQIKRIEGNYDGTRSLSLRAAKLLSRVACEFTPEPCYMGLHLTDFLDQCRMHYQAAWDGQGPPTGRPPRFILAGLPGA